MSAEPGDRIETRRSAAAAALVVLAAVVGLGLMVDSIGRSSATYDETLYLETAAWWWRTGAQESISRAGSPLSFWKIQQIPVLRLLDQTGRGSWIDDPKGHEPELLTWARLGGLWIWVAALLTTALWSLRLHGRAAMVLAAWWFALSPNLLAHGALATMELPATADSVGSAFLFWRHLATGRRRAFVASGLLAGVAFSCKFTAVLWPILYLATWVLDRRPWGFRALLRTTARAMILGAAFVALMIVGDLLVTGFATVPASRQVGRHPSIEARFSPALARVISAAAEMPIPQDFVGFFRQFQHQRSGGLGYLLGERGIGGWRHYYLVAMAVKIPLLFWVVLVARLAANRRIEAARPSATPIIIAVLYLAAASVGSSRNFGFRYLLPVAPLAIVWISGLAQAGRLGRTIALVGLVGQALAVASSHPYELTYFNELASGRTGGRKILADSNLDWGQGLKGLVDLQRNDPRLRDLTLYYFGDTDPRVYGVAGSAHVVHAERTDADFPLVLQAPTAYLAVSASLEWGPWGPPGFFHELAALEPIAMTADSTIAVYRSSDLAALRARGEGPSGARSEPRNRGVPRQ